MTDLTHYGTPRKSGRYPWGSGEAPYQNGASFQSQIAEMREAGLTEAEIAKAFGMKTPELRAKISIAQAEARSAAVAQAMKLKATGMSNSAIGREMGINESTVRSLLDPAKAARTSVLENTANMLEDQMGEKKYLDVGLGSEVGIGISKEKLSTAVAMMEERGYTVHNIQIEQVGNPGKYTETKVLCPPGTELRDVYANQHEIRPIQSYTDNYGADFRVVKDPVKISLDRIAVRYGDEGGAEKDGTIEIRPGIDDVSLGGSSYAQVRIAVEGDKYMKGMAVYATDLPPGVDIRYNTPKLNTGNKADAMKNMSDDPDSPFGAVVRQRHFLGADGKEHLSAINLVGSPTKEGSGEEGQWDGWSKTLSSQMLSKQSPQLAKQQLDLAYRDRKADYDEIMSLTNPTVKKRLLDSFAEDCDAATVKLPAKALPGQTTKVILPLRNIKDNEVYAPSYANGTDVVLIRHPHGGVFEIPQLKVNNRNAEGKSILKNAQDAIGINHKVAAQLSGADFDGDTVLVIPMPKVGPKIRTSKPLSELKGFVTTEAYPGYPGMKRLEGKTKQIEMGKVSNLITDMTVKGATNAEIAKAVKHSMVVIDAEKHNLNWKQSEKDNDIALLKKRYQAKDDGTPGGASTLISRSSSPVRIPHQVTRPYRDGGPINKKTGEVVWVPTGEGYTKTKTNKKTGVVTESFIPRTMEVSRIRTVRDANKLVSKPGTDIERVYATHANRLKALANEARLSSLRTTPNPVNPAAKKRYAAEVASLKAKLNTSLKNKPLERVAQAMAGHEVREKTRANPGMDAAQLKKVKTTALIKNRARMGTSSSRINITPREWEAIQKGAISNHVLAQILAKADSAQVKQYATPRTKTGLSPSKVAQAKAMAARNYTTAEIAAQLGVSASTISSAINE